MVKKLNLDLLRPNIIGHLILIKHRMIDDEWLQGLNDCTTAANSGPMKFYNLNHKIKKMVF